jgi:hypothetical protein
MKRILLCLALVMGCSGVVQAGEFLGLATGILAMRRPKPKPAPSPAPNSDICENCNGVGKVGDGTIMLTCVVCKGSGKKVAADPPPSLPPDLVVPIYVPPAPPPKAAAPPPPGTCRTNADGSRTCTPAKAAPQLFRFRRR